MFFAGRPELFCFPLSILTLRALAFFLALQRARAVRNGSSTSFSTCASFSTSCLGGLQASSVTHQGPMVGTEVCWRRPKKPPRARPCVASCTAHTFYERLRVFDSHRAERIEPPRRRFCDRRPRFRYTGTILHMTHMAQNGYYCRRCTKCIYIYITPLLFYFAPDRGGYTRTNKTVFFGFLFQFLTKIPTRSGFF